MRHRILVEAFPRVELVVQPNVEEMLNLGSIK